MRNTREAVASALLTLLQGVTFSQPVGGAVTWRSTSRKLKVFSEVPPVSRPALFLTEHHEDTSYQSENLPPKMSMSFNVFIYLNGKGAAVPAVDLNVILDAIDVALAPEMATGRQTLGNLVSHCRIDGQTLKDPGDLDGDGLLWIPIRILGP